MMKGRKTNNGRLLLFSILVVLLAFGSICTSVSGAETTSEASTEAQVAITNVSLDPAIFMQDDQGTLTVRIANSGTSPVAIDRVELLSEELKVVNYQTYDKVGTLGEGNSLSFTFVLEADGKDGTFFPIFYVDFTNAGSMRYPVPVKVDDTTIMVSVINSPDTFSAGEEDEITLSVSNPRDNEVNSVTIIPGGQGITSSQTALFIGTLKPDEEKQVTFGITPKQATELVFTISYRNGPNQHYETLTLPVKIGDRKVAAEIVVNGIEVTGGGSSMTISGDVTNAGLKDAKSVTVTVSEPAKPVDPDPIYVIGALEPDDFSSFEITCTAQGASEIPLVVSYRDEEGKTYQETFKISARTNGNSTVSGSSQLQPGAPSTNGRQGGGGLGIMGFGSGLSKVPIVPILVIILAGIVGIVAWRKGYLNRIRERFRK
ncbi:MAG: hypothetical protein MUE45_06160 [Methanoregulaceae archaeon]|jgi:hypothetical protein|nr:hypothetical protein [Methanoregulaceae archaeon]MCU0629051.1 hypothetical protein [Methanoregulaceae archaeon]